MTNQSIEEYQLYIEKHKKELQENSCFPKKMTRLDYDSSQVQHIKYADFKLPGNRFARMLGYLVPEVNYFPLEEPLGSSLLVNEYIVSLMLQRRGYDVIKPEGIFEIIVPGSLIGREKDIIGPALVREWKEGILFDNIQWPKEEARDQIENIVERANADGFEHYFKEDILNASNYIWVPKERKIYPYDLSLWVSEHEERSQLNKELGFKN